MSPAYRGLCRPRHLPLPPHPRGKPGFSTAVRYFPRETDCLLEGAGFELLVPHHHHAGREVLARVSSRVPLPIAYVRSPDPLQLGGSSIAPLANSRCLPLRLAVEEVHARPAETINHQRLCFFVSYS